MFPNATERFQNAEEKNKMFRFTAAREKMCSLTFPPFVRISSIPVCVCVNCVILRRIDNECGEKKKAVPVSPHRAHKQLIKTICNISKPGSYYLFSG